MNSGNQRSTALRSTAFRTTIAAALLLALAGCAGATGGNSRLDSVEASGDGVLRIGLIQDSTGEQGFLNDSQRAAAELAVKDINAAGGHKGRPVELIIGAGDDAGSQAMNLTAAKADVVIGPTDSSNATAAIDVLSADRIPLISPANTAAALSTYKSGGYYFRTAAADIAQASVLVKLAKDGGAKSISLVHQDSVYGEDVSAAVASAATDAGLATVSTSAFKPGSAQQAAVTAHAAKPDAVVLIAREDAQGALAELNNAGLSGSKVILSDGAFAQYGSGLGSKALDGARAVVPGVFAAAAFQARLLAVSPALKDLSFAAEAYDAVNVAALAAATADDDAGRSIAANLITVSGGTAGGQDAGQPGKPCLRYADCLAVLKSGAKVNYDGESGPIAFDSQGDITTANFMVFTYGADNRAVLSGREASGRAAG
ncbi:ABC transporter substrate-binding protein [Pseudarthrobacter sulfonivorans]|uniref:ABC transporter substrate-binding protein n=1 Tax=Pseudarthrobacter sulfonivorans TaxID=121292 RepID=UPI00285D614F|nr:ABC transporter substrate-binding protein [Pseudarthrobacter sulfonivorans]MDR6417304.1 branched-chain amino acid transport system substrate-binding protein [Pseudarthrobacter sulfonivorans]